MSVTTKDAVIAQGPSRLSLFWMSTVGKKILMAISGIILFAYVIAHMLGNMQFYMGKDVINKYAEFLHWNQGLLWTARIVLLAAVLIHAIAAIQLWVGKREARPIAYRAKENIQASAASRTMIWTGAIIALFIVYHVLDLTIGSAHLPQGSYVELDPAVNLSEGFTLPLPVVLYIVAMIALGFHLWHGVYSMFSTLGLSHPRYTEGVKRLAAAAATIIAVADISFPVAVFMNLVRYTR